MIKLKWILWWPSLWRRLFTDKKNYNRGDDGRVKGEMQGKRRKRQQGSLLEVTSRDAVRIKQGTKCRYQSCAIKQDALIVDFSHVDGGASPC